MKLSIYCSARFFDLRFSVSVTISSPPDMVSTHSHTTGILLSPVFGVEEVVLGVVGVVVGSAVFTILPSGLSVTVVMVPVSSSRLISVGDVSAVGPVLACG